MFLICFFWGADRARLFFWIRPGVGRSNSGDVPLEECDWEMVGLLPLYDPPRHDTAETIKYGVSERGGLGREGGLRERGEREGWRS